MSIENRKTLLLVEHDSIMAFAHSSLLFENGYNVTIASSGEIAIAKIQEASIDLILMDIDLGPGIDGTETARKILLSKEIPIVFLTSHSEKEVVEKVRDITRYGYVIKNSGKFVLLSSIEMAFELFDMHKKTREKELLIHEKEERLRLALVAGNQGLYDLDLITGKAMVNSSYAQMLGYEFEDFEETNINWRDRLHENDREPTYMAYTEYVQGTRSEYKVEFRQRTKDGYWKWILSQGKISEWDVKGIPIRMIGTHTDITEKKHSELMQRARNKVLDSLIAKEGLDIILHEIIHEIESIHPDMHASILLFNADGRLVRGAAPSLPEFYNRAIESIRVGVGVGSCGTAAATGELVIVTDIRTHSYWENFREVAERANLKACWSFPFKDDSGNVLGTFAAYYDKPKSPSKAELDIIIEFSRITGLAVQNNKTEMERIKAEDEVKSLLSEKEILLKEVHHRIKNNMASITSLLSLQADYVNEPRVTHILEEAQHRILSMMLIYDKLFRSVDYKNISVKEYLNDLLDQILISFPGASKVIIERHFEDFNLNSKSLFSVGIIINELITNAFKYAFSEIKEGKIIVTAKKIEGDNMELTVSDNGVGLPKDFNIQNSKGFGLSLIRLLTQKKGNSFETMETTGTKFRVVIAV